MDRPFELVFSEGLAAYAIRIRHQSELPVALNILGLRRTGPVLVLIGGASDLSETDMARLRPLFVNVLAPLAEAVGAAVVDGGTDAGVMRLMGQVRFGAGATFPLIGVSPAGTISMPMETFARPSATPLEPHHTHFVLVPGTEWGDESPWLSLVASVLAEGGPAVAVVVDGGETTWEDVRRSVGAGQPVVVVSGSGRTADVLAAALRGQQADERAQSLSKSGLIEAVELAADRDVLWSTLERLLSPRN